MIEYTTSSGPVTTNDTSIVIDPQVAIGSRNAAPAFNWTATAGYMQLLGTIWGSTGISAPTIGLSQIYIEAGGALACRGGTAIYGGVGTVTNHGAISGRLASTAHNFTLYNYSTISNSSFVTSFGNAIYSAADQNTRLYNYGTIAGYYNAITADAGAVTISNHGTIAAGNNNLGTSGGSVIQIIGIAALNLTNNGTISGEPDTALGAISAADQADQVINNGLIVGDVLLAGGSDRFDTTSGTLAGLLDLGDGADIGIGGAGIDRMAGGTGTDILFGNAGDDLLDGGGDDDILDGGAGADRMTGGAGNDLFYIDTAQDRVFEDANGGMDTVYASASCALRGGQEIEFLLAVPPTDAVGLTLVGNEFAQVINGDAGDNRIVGGGGADTLGGYDGDDTYIVSNSGVTIVEEANGGYDTVVTRVSLTLADNVEAGFAADPGGTTPIDLRGNTLDNVLHGNAGDNILDGGTGADRLVGGAGMDVYLIDDAGDVISDSSGYDTVRATVSYVAPNAIERVELTGSAAIDATGNVHDNTIFGNDADNVVSGGRGGQDLLIGGGGADAFLMRAAILPANFATVVDFNGGADRIGLGATIFRNVGSAGTLGDAFLTEGAATTRDQHILYDAATGMISYDRDGSGTHYDAVAFAGVTPGTMLTAADFLVI